jgi:hypothetical protein
MELLFARVPYRNIEHNRDYQNCDAAREFEIPLSGEREKTVCKPGSVTRTARRTLTDK